MKMTVSGKNAGGKKGEITFGITKIKRRGLKALRREWIGQTLLTGG